MQEIMEFGHVCVGSTWEGDDRPCKVQVPIGWIGGKGMPDRLPLESLATSTTPR